jgi:predicted Zn-dependent protease
LPAARVEAKSNAGWVSYNHHVLCWIAHRGKVYQLSGTTADENWSRYHAPLSKAVESFRTLAAKDRKRIREAHVRVVDAKSGENVASLVKRVDSAWSPKRTAAANDISSEDAVLRSGQPVKVARWEAYTGNSD